MGAQWPRRSTSRDLGRRSLPVVTVLADYQQAGRLEAICGSRRTGSWTCGTGPMEIDVALYGTDPADFGVGGRDHRRAGPCELQGKTTVEVEVGAMGPRCRSVPQTTHRPMVGRGVEHDVGDAAVAVVGFAATRTSRTSLAASELVPCQVPMTRRTR